jgi:PTS system arbutin-like IIC component
MTLYIFGVVGNLGGGLLDGASLVWLPLIKNHTGLVIGNIVIGLIFTGIYFVVFRYLILKLDIKTPGRTEEKAKLYTKKDFKEKQASGKPESIYVTRARAFIELLGGASNIVSVSNCATRLRLNVVDESLVQEADIFKEYGALGLVKNIKAIQVIVGLDVPNVKEEFDKLI